MKQSSIVARLVYACSVAAVLFVTASSALGDPATTVSTFDRRVGEGLRHRREDGMSRAASESGRAGTIDYRRREREQQTARDTGELRAFAEANAVAIDDAVREVHQRVEAWVEDETQRVRDDHRNRHAAARERLGARIAEGRNMGEMLIAANSGGAAAGGGGPESALISSAGQAIGNALDRTSDSRREAHIPNRVNVQEPVDVVTVPHGQAEEPVQPSDLPAGVMLGSSTTVGRESEPRSQTKIPAPGAETTASGKIASYPHDGTAAQYAEALVGTLPGSQPLVKVGSRIPFVDGYAHARGSACGYGYIANDPGAQASIQYYKPDGSPDNINSACVEHDLQLRHMGKSAIADANDPAVRAIHRKLVAVADDPGFTAAFGLVNAVGSSRQLTIEAIDWAKDKTGRAVHAVQRVVNDLVR